jgi:hypothetical protein
LAVTVSGVAGVNFPAIDVFEREVMENPISRKYFLGVASGSWRGVPSPSR